jgi:hypothetical protein
MKNSDDIKIPGQAPDQDAFIAWAKLVDAYFSAHPTLLTKGERREDAPFAEGTFGTSRWRYEAKHTYSFTTVMRPIFGGEEQRTQHTSTIGARTYWHVPGGNLFIELRPEGKDYFRKTHIEYPAKIVASPKDWQIGHLPPASSTSRAPAGVIVQVTESDYYLHVKTPKHELFRQWAHRHSGKFERGSSSWRFSRSEREALDAELRRIFGTAGEAVPTVDLVVRFTPTFEQRFVHRQQFESGTLIGAYLDRPLATRFGSKPVEFDPSMKVISGGFDTRAMGLSVRPGTVLLVPGVARPLAERLIAGDPDTFEMQEARTMAAEPRTPYAKAAAQKTLLDEDYSGPQHEDEAEAYYEDLLRENPQAAEPRGPYQKTLLPAEPSPREQEQIRALLKGAA